MELKEYLKLFKKYAIFIVLCAVLGTILGAFSTRFLPSGYTIQETFFIAGPTSTTGAYDYEGFYSQEKARNFTDTAVAILESHDFQKEIFRNGSLEVKKLAPQVIRLTVVNQDPKSAKEMLANVKEGFNKKFIELGTNQSLSIKEIAPAEEPSFKRSSRKIYALGGVVMGFAVSVVVISLKSYFKL